MMLLITGQLVNNSIGKFYLLTETNVYSHFIPGNVYTSAILNFS